MEQSFFRAIRGAVIGALVALLVTAIVSRQFTDFATETNATIMEKVERNKDMTYLEAVAELERLHRRIAQTGGWRGFLAQRILDNGGLGFPEVNKPAGKVWLWACAVGVLIGIIGTVAEKWWIPLLTVVVLAVGVPGIVRGPVAVTTILLGGLAGGAVAIAVLRIGSYWSSSANKETSSAV